MDHPTESLDAYQAAIRNNPHSVPSLKACADIYRKQETREGYTKVRLLLRALTLSLRRLLGPAISRCGLGCSCRRRWSFCNAC